MNEEKAQADLNARLAVIAKLTSRAASVWERRHALLAEASKEADRRALNGLAVKLNSTSAEPEED